MDDRIVRIGLIRDLSYVVSLQKKWSNELGFLPRLGLRRFLKRRTALIVEERGLPAGYVLLYPNEIGVGSIVQCAVDPEVLRTTIGTELVRRVTSMALERECFLLRLGCREDLPANEFWRTMGFHLGGVKRCANARGRRVLLYGKELRDFNSMAG